MRSVLTVFSDENLMQRFKIAETDNTIRYFYANNGEDAIHISEDYEIAVCIIDFKLPIISGEELCEAILDNNPKTEIILVFDEQHVSDVLRVYNLLHISKLICKQNFVLEELPKLIESSLHMYNRLEEIKKSDVKKNKINEKYLKPMQEMSTLLNDRMNGYQQVIHIFNDCIKFISGRNDKALKALNIFVDRIINDYIQVYMVREPDYKFFLDSLNDTYNIPSEKKYFRFTNELSAIPEHCVREILMGANAITIAYEMFFNAYRGKINLSEDNSAICFNCIYEAVDFKEEGVDSATVIEILRNILADFSDRIQFARKDNIVQLKAFYKLNIQEANNNG